MVTNREDVSIAIRSAFLKKGTQQKFSLIALILISVILLYVDTFENRPLKFTRSFVKDIIYKALNEFFDLHICCYENYKEVEINFIGSVSYYLSDEIHLVATKHNCKIGSIVQNPIKRLVNFHFNNITSVKSRYGYGN